MVRLRAAPAGEWAFIDLREEGEAAEGHPFGSVNLPYSRLELELGALVPRPDTPLVLFDGGNDLAARAALRLGALGYQQLSIVDGGALGWEAAGFPLFKGVHTWSKAFGEWVQHEFDVPEIGPHELLRQRALATPPVLIDGRPLAEHRAFTLPGALNCPNADLPLALPALAEADLPVIVHCAGRTRSIIGAQTLRDFGLPNPVMALRDGTQGWELAGFQRDIGANRPMPAPSPSQIAAATARAKAVIAAHGLPTLTAAGLEAWQGDQSRTTYLFDPRSDGTPPSGFRATHGTTLVQQTDRFIAVKGARVVLWDPGLVRSTFAALWLNRMGIMAHVLLEPPQPTTPATGLPLPAAPRALDAPALDAALAQGALVLDLRPVAAFRAAHLAKARRAIRPQIPALGLPENSKIVLVASDSDSARAALVAHDLATAGHAVLGLTLDPKLWQEHGLPLDKSVADAPLDDPETVQFCAGRHSGNLQDARLYLAWETGLLDRLSAAGLTPWPALLPHQRPQAGAQTWL